MDTSEYEIFEDWIKYPDIGSYLFENSIRHRFEIFSNTRHIPDKGWLNRVKPKFISVYKATLTPEDALYIKLTFPDVCLSKTLEDLRGELA